jgi:hypothetical protein
MNTKRRLTKKAVLAGAMAIGAAYSPFSSAFLTNFYFDPDGAGVATKTLVNEFFDLVGPSYVQTTAPSGLNFNFNEWGAVRSDTHDSAGSFSDTGFLGEITAFFTTSGNATLGGTINYTGGTISIYSGATRDFGSANGIYGADNGTLIGTFTPVSGVGSIDPTGIPNGQQTISARATFLAPGYWFNQDGVTQLAAGTVFGFATTNASYLQNPTTAMITELVNGAAGDPTFGNVLPTPGAPGAPGTPGEFIISNNGQFRLNVPEPGSLLLAGIGLLGMGYFRRRGEKA